MGFSGGGSSGAATLAIGDPVSNATPNSLLDVDNNSDLASGPLTGSVVLSSQLTQPGQPTGGLYAIDTDANFGLGGSLPDINPGIPTALTVQWTSATAFTVQAGSLASLLAGMVGWFVTGTSVAAGTFLATVNTTTGACTVIGTGYSGSLNTNVTATVYGAHGNTMIGSEGLGGVLTVGWHNVAIGAGGFVNASSAYLNVAIGDGAMEALTTGSANVAIGGGSCLTSLQTGTNNIAIGNNALEDATTAASCVAIGSNALQNAVANIDCIAIGLSAANATTSSYNIAVGSAALESNVTGQYNIAIGHNCLTTSTGNYNVGIGYNCLQFTTATESVGVGYAALVNATGGQNVGVGFESGENVSSGQLNTFVGSGVGGAITTGGENVHIGGNAGTGGSNANVSYSTLVGYNSVAGASETTALGAKASATAAGAVAIGIDSASTGASAGTANQFALGTANHQVQISNNTTGGGLAALGANCPAVTATAPYTWFKMMSSDGSTVYVPAWK